MAPTDDVKSRPTTADDERPFGGVGVHRVTFRVSRIEAHANPGVVDG